MNSFEKIASLMIPTELKMAADVALPAQQPDTGAGSYNRNQKEHNMQKQPSAGGGGSTQQPAAPAKPSGAGGASLKGGGGHQPAAAPAQHNNSGNFQSAAPEASSFFPKVIPNYI